MVPSALDYNCVHEWNFEVFSPCYCIYLYSNLHLTYLFSVLVYEVCVNGIRLLDISICTLYSDRKLKSLVNRWIEGMCNVSSMEINGVMPQTKIYTGY